MSKLNWQKSLITRVDELMKQIDPKIIKEIKWKKPSNPLGVPVWSCKGIICTGEIYKDKVKFTFMKGSSLAGTTNLFNSGKGVRRAVDFFEKDKLDEKSFKSLIIAAIKLNSSESDNKNI